VGINSRAAIRLIKITGRNNERAVGKIRKCCRERVGAVG
jgi:hypothetical protein